MDEDNPRFLYSVLVGAAVTIIAILTVLIVMDAAKAHQAPSGMRYDTWCCNGNNHTGDCQPIPNSSVRVIPGGYEITLSRGDHHMVTKTHVFTKTQTETRPSTDGQYHACLYPNEDSLRCFYAPPPGV